MPYLDHAGASLPSDSQMLAVCQSMMSHRLSNPHSRHSTSNTTHVIVENARERVLSHFGASSVDYAVVFTYNTSHSLRIVAENFQFGKKRKEGCEITDILTEGPSFAYLADSHNSVVGLREIVKNKVDTVSCLRSLPDSIPAGEGNLFVLTAASNFCGRKYNLDLVRKLREKGWCVCLDAASLTSSSVMSLQSQPDFVAFSFYKIFGYPTGLGALLIRKESAGCLSKSYFSGGTVAAALPSKFISFSRSRIEERFEDGTTNYYAIAVLQKGFDDLKQYGGMEKIQSHCFELARKAVEMLRSKYHWNGQPAIEIYTHNKAFDNPSTQSAIVAFNMKDEDGEYIGYSQVSKMADLFGIDLRTGCFCNIGACQQYLGLSDDDVLRNRESGKECGDEMDLIGGRPTGAVRISFGRQNTKEDIDVLEQMLDYCFLSSQPASLISHPLSIDNYRPTISRILCYPVKSCRGFELDSSVLTRTGLEFDRHLMIVNNDVTLTQKKYPRLFNIDTKMISPHELELSSSDSKIIVDLQSHLKGGNIRNIVCVNTVSVNDCGSDVSSWLSKELDMAGCRLRRVAEDSDRSLVNTAPLLLVNEASVNLLAQQIGLSLDDALLRFRPNIVVRGLPPFIEDQAATLTINDVPFEVTEKCTRCEMICVDQRTGEKDPAMIVALRNFRHREKMTFGIYIRELHPLRNIVVVGDKVRFQPGTPLED